MLMTEDAPESHGDIPNQPPVNELHPSEINERYVSPEELETLGITPEEHTEQAPSPEIPTENKIAEIGQFMVEEVNPRLAAINRLHKMSGSRQDSPVDYWQRDAVAHSIFIPDVAEQVTSYYDGDPRESHPSTDFIKAHVGGVNLLSKVAGKRFRPKLDAVLEKKAEQVDRATETYIEAVDTIASVPRPREQFVNELGSLYRGIPKAQKNGYSLAGYLKFAVETLRNPQSQTERQNYPMLTRIIDKLPPQTIDDLQSKLGNADIVAPEIVRCIATFLRDSGQEVADIPLPRPDHHLRTMGELPVNFSGDTSIEQIENRIARGLTLVSGLLPEDGPAFAEKLKGVMRNIAGLRRVGKTEREIAAIIFESWRD